MGRYDFSLYDLICRNASCYTERRAWLDADTGDAVTFGQIKQRVDRWASGLTAAGIRAGDRIGARGQKQPVFFSALRRCCRYRSHRRAH